MNEPTPASLPLPARAEGSEKHYNEETFWQKLRMLPKSSLSQILERALLLRELLLSSSTPLWARASILTALGYFCLPIDLIPDPVPVAGYLDDIAIMGLVLANLDEFVTEEMRLNVHRRLPKSFQTKPEETEDVTSQNLD